MRFIKKRDYKLSVSDGSVNVLSTCKKILFLFALDFAAESIRYSHGRNLVEDTGDVTPPFFQTGGRNMPCPPTFFSLSFIWRGSKNESDVCHVLCEVFFMLHGRPHT